MCNWCGCVFDTNYIQCAYCGDKIEEEFRSECCNELFCHEDCLEEHNCQIQDVGPSYFEPDPPDKGERY